MITLDMRNYNYFTFGAKNTYGQPQLSDDVKGTIKMAINTTGTTVQDNVRYKDASYIGLTLGNIDETFVIDYNGEKLKVLYVNPRGRYKQVFMKNI